MRFAAVLWSVAVCAAADFARDIEPLFRAHCYGCHGSQTRMAGLRFDRKESAERVLRDGKLLAMVESGKMPPGRSKLAASEVARLREWIASGAEWPSEAKRRHWAFEPVRRPELPAVRNGAWPRNAIDRFILARLEKEGIAPSREANERTLARRMSLDLIGLPPEPGAPVAVEALLASPHFGERWARPWLDLARYADSDGYEQDQPRPHAWRYREWVIDALNRNMPFDRFTIEQIAGDLLPDATVPQKTAAGFHRNTLTSREGGIDLEQLRTDQVTDRASTVATVWLGLTFECARCHDHKYDPVSQRDFYRLYAYFNSADEVNVESPLAGEEERYRARLPEYERKFAELRRAHRVEELQPKWEREVLAAMAAPSARLEWTQVLDYLAVFQDRGHDILRTPPARRTPRQSHDLTRVFLKYPGPLADWPEAQGAKFGEGYQKLEDLDAQYPGPGEIPTLAERIEPRPTHVFQRGDFRSPGERVEPGTPEFLGPAPRGGRLALARWLVSSANPMAARVAVNRFWQEMFGRGLVATAGDFGARGEAPTHPELLDWLAAEFVESGWNVKHILALIADSATYRQASAVRGDLRERDPSNLLLARQSRLRLPAEAIRDNALAASGLLERRVGGPSVRPPMPKALVQVAYRARAWLESQGPDRYRRGLYTFFWRSVPHPQSMNFDAPNSLVSCTRRERSTTPLQALNLLNDPSFHEAAEALGRAMARLPGPERIRFAFERCLNRRPEPAEIDRLRTYFEAARARRGEEFALSGLASVLLNLEEFITRE